MAWIIIDELGERVVDLRPIKDYEHKVWKINDFAQCVYLPKGSIEKLIGRELTWDDEPVEI
jgi:hypothetical protein